jgi:uncharacterized membrane protein
LTVWPSRVGDERAEESRRAGLLTGATAIGLAPIFVRLSETGSTATAFWRVTLAAPFLWVWMRLEVRRRTFNWALLWPGVFFACDLAVWHVSIRWTSVANATLLANAAPIFVALVAWLWWRERLRWTFAVGLLVALCGAALVMRASFEMSARHFHGDLLGRGNSRVLRRLSTQRKTIASLSRDGNDYVLVDTGVGGCSVANLARLWRTDDASDDAWLDGVAGTGGDFTRRRTRIDRVGVGTRASECVER